MSHFIVLLLFFFGCSHKAPVEETRYENPVIKKKKKSIKTLCNQDSDEFEAGDKDNAPWWVKKLLEADEKL
jgi:hypothetical protein